MAEEHNAPRRSAAGTALLDPTPSGPSRAEGPVGVAVAAALAVGVAAGAAWWATRLGGEALVVSVTIAATVAGAVVVRAVGGAAHARTRRIAVALTLLAGIVLVGLAWSGTLAAAKFATQRAAWTAEAEALLARADGPPYECESFPTDPPDLPAFGRIDGRCVNRGHTRTVSYSQRDPMGGWTGLLYSPDLDSPQVMSQCVAHLAGPWWQTAGATPDCPAGFTFIGA